MDHPLPVHGSAVIDAATIEEGIKGVSGTQPVGSRRTGARSTGWENAPPRFRRRQPV